VPLPLQDLTDVISAGERLSNECRDHFATHGRARVVENAVQRHVAVGVLRPREERQRREGGLVETDVVVDAKAVEHEARRGLVLVRQGHGERAQQELQSRQRVTQRRRRAGGQQR
jgi:hypothetical protein